MTSEIEKTREELEQSRDTELQDNDDYQQAKGKLEGFNLGVELAQKEFLEWLEKHLEHKSRECYFYTENKIKELKQSIGRKE
jgi:hypothetical protein